MSKSFLSKFSNAELTYVEGVYVDTKKHKKQLDRLDFYSTHCVGCKGNLYTNVDKAFCMECEFHKDECLNCNKKRPFKKHCNNFQI